MSDKKYATAKQFLKRHKKDINIMSRLPTETLSRIATGEIDAVMFATILLGRRMILHYTKNGDTKVKT